MMNAKSARFSPSFITHHSAFIIVSMPRITRISSSFAIVMIAYWAYALIAVPCIEPAVELNPGSSVVEGSDIPETEDPSKMQLERVRDLFPPDAWEVTSSNIKVLESDRAKLLLQSYRNLGGGKVEIKPCTIVFEYDGSAANEEQRHRQSIILQAPAAILQFDRPLDLTQPKEANLTGGELNGAVVIRSDWKQPGPEDDLRIETSNIRLTQHTISTPERVEFRWGPHFGSGQNMLMKLLAGKPRPGGATSGLNIDGIRVFELQHVERLHLDLGKDPEKLVNASSTTGPEGASRPSEQSAPPSESTPVEIGCRGSFRFDVTGRVATFRDTVWVERLNAAGPPDRIDCDLLSLRFIERPRENPPAIAGRPAARRAGSMDMTPERLEAVGNPVVVTAPSENVVARAQRIEYNILAKSIMLDGNQTVMMQQGANEIRARGLIYRSAEEEGRLGQLASQGPGWLRGQSKEKPDQQIEATWQDQLLIERREQHQVISLLGGARLKSPKVGELQAKDIFLWLTETPSREVKNKFDHEPHGLTASKDVRFGSSRLSGAVDQLEVEFRKVADDQGSGAADQGLTAISAQPGQGMGGLAADGAAVQLPHQPTGVAQPIQLLPQTSAEQAAQSHFKVAGRRLLALVLMTKPEPVLSDLTIEDNVEFDETQTVKPDDLPAKIRGNRLVVERAHRPDACAKIIGQAGQPAHFEAQGLGLTGSTITLDNGTNHLLMDGPGQMDILMRKDLEGRPLPMPSNLRVLWQQGMNFNGQTARFDESVVASTPGIPSQSGMTAFELKSRTMEVQLQRMIRFSDTKNQPETQIEEIRCFGGVTMDSRSFDTRQQLVSHDQMRVTDLAINQISGNLNGGSGWVNSVRYGSDDALMGPPGTASANMPAKPPTLISLHVKFQGSMTGNPLSRQVQSHQVTFTDQVRITYAPVDDWDAMVTTDDPSRLGPKGAVARCDRLTVFQVPLPASDQRAIELYMSGNAMVEGTTFKALGSSIKYAQAKELLTLEGDGRNPAKVLRQEQIGGVADPLVAQKILYWRKTNDFRLVEPQMLEVQLPEMNGKR